MLRAFLNDAHIGRPVWLPDVRAAFAAAVDTAPLVLQLSSFDGLVRAWPLPLPRWRDEAERSFVRDYLCASVYNAMSVCGGWEIRFFCDTHDMALAKLLHELPERFQCASYPRSGIGKAVSIAERMCRTFGTERFAFAFSDIREYTPPAAAAKAAPDPLAPRLRSLCASAEKVNCVGIDVGGTDIKLAASVRGRLVAVREYDWNPASFATAEEIMEPILLLTRLMRAVIAADGKDAALTRALDRDTPDAEVAAAVSAAEARWDTRVLDAVGLSFPDVVLHGRIVGGETPKTDGIRKNTALDYEQAFAKLSTLKERLAALCRGGGRVGIINDGSMAAFTAAVELACGARPDAAAQGVIAHSLGTDLGTGWLDERGQVPPVPLELYDLWLDLGSAPCAALPPEDLRSTRNENSGLPGIRRYLGQSGAFRLAWEADPLLLDGFTEETDGALRIKTQPQDLRKRCLEHLMRRADEGDAAAASVFREIGRNLAVVSREFDHLLHPAAHTRFLFGRFVKSPRCFALIREGFASGISGVRLVSGGDTLVETPLMRELAGRKDVTVAQFAQAVGALYYSVFGG